MVLLFALFFTSWSALTRLSALLADFGADAVFFAEPASDLLGMMVTIIVHRLVMGKGADTVGLGCRI